MKALVLAGGFATRLRPLSYALPKQLFPILGKPLIYWVLDTLRRSKVKEALLLTNYLSDMIMSRVGQRYRGVKIKYYVEDEPLGTGGPLRLVSKHEKLPDPFILMNGDLLAEFDFRAIVEEHKKRGALVTMALKEVEDPRRFGLVRLGEGMRISAFLEKPKRFGKGPYLINAGAYVMSPEVIRHIPAGRKVSLEKDVFPKLAAMGKAFGHMYRGPWRDMGTLKDYIEANFQLLKEACGKGAVVKKTATVRRGAKLVAPLFLGNGSTVEPGAVVGPYAIVGNGSIISSGARVVRSLLMDGVVVERDAVVQGSILAHKVLVGGGARLGEGTVVASGSVICRGVKLLKGVIVHPYKEVEKSVKGPCHVL